jgi:IS30 family transposase
MSKTYTRLTHKERFEIEKLLSHNKSYTEIGFVLNRHKSSISREVNLYGRNNYNATDAHLKATCNASDRRCNKSKINLCAELKKNVLDRLEDFWSPSLISEMLSKEFSDRKEMQVTAETIYSHIYDFNGIHQRNLLIKQLYQQRKYRGNLRRGADKRSTIKDKISIKLRPEHVGNRIEPGHWEGDLILGKEGKSAIGTLVERSSRVLILVHLKGKDSLTVRKAFERAFKHVPRHMKKSMTYDNGTEMAQHALFTKNTKTDVYFADPYSPWQRGTNENTNGLLRSFFPKGTDLSLITKKQLKQVEIKLNQRPRRILNYETPANIFLNYCHS